MELSARAIHEKQFHDAWRGYNQEEVDEFLDRLADAVERAQRENQQLRDRIRELDASVQQSRESEEMLKRTLMTAQQAAEDAIEKAKRKAEELIAEADERAKRAAAESRDRSREAEERVKQLRDFERESKTRLRTFFQQQLKALDALTEVRPPTLSGTPRPAAPTGFERVRDDDRRSGDRSETRSVDDRLFRQG